MACELHLNKDVNKMIITVYTVEVVIITAHNKGLYSRLRFCQ